MGSWAHILVGTQLFKASVKELGKGLKNQTSYDGSAMWYVIWNSLDSRNLLDRKGPLYNRKSFFLDRSCLKTLNGVLFIFNKSKCQFVAPRLTTQHH